MFQTSLQTEETFTLKDYKRTHKTTANCISKANTVVHHFGKADFHGKKRVAIVGQESGALQWPKGYTTTGTGRYSDRYIQKRLGVCTSRNQNRESMTRTFILELLFCLDAFHYRRKRFCSKRIIICE